MVKIRTHFSSLSSSSFCSLLRVFPNTVLNPYIFCLSSVDNLATLLLSVSGVLSRRLEYEVSKFGSSMLEAMTPVNKSCEAKNDFSKLSILFESVICQSYSDWFMVL